MQQADSTFRQTIIKDSFDEFTPVDSKRGFVNVAGRMLEEAEELIDFVPCFFRGQGSRRRNISVDGYSFDDADGSLRLMITEFYGGDDPETLNQTIAKSIFSKVVSFVEDSLAGNLNRTEFAEDAAMDLASTINIHRASITRFRFYLVTDGLLSDRIRDWPEDSIERIPSEFHIWDINRLRTTLNSESGREELSINFENIIGGGIPCLKASLNQDDYSGYLCVIPGETLAQIYDEFGSRLLEGNVRSFLGKAGKVNKAIRETVLKTPEMFFAYNNGISATATSVDIRETTSGPRLIQANNLQIVNGGQTTASLAFTKRKDGADLSQIFVQMKLSVVSADRAGTFIPKISEYSNKQNKVSDSDLFSNHEFHIKLEEISRRLKAPAKLGSQRQSSWFYERVKGQYRIETAKMSPAEKLRFELDHPKIQVITKTDIAKVDHSWRQLPNEVSKGAQKNFDLYSKLIVSEWARDPLQFNDEFFRKIVAQTIIFKELEKIIPQQPWYEGGYRANIVTFTIAKLSNLIERFGGGKTIDNSAIWKKQAASEVLIKQLMLIAEVVYSVIKKPEQGLENVTEWCKKELAWQRVCDANIELLPELRNELVSKDIVEDRLATAKSDAKIDVGFAAIKRVLDFKSQNWKIARDWGLSNNQLTPKEQQLLLIATLPGKVPSEKQAAAILLILKKLQDEGFSLD